MVVLGEGEGDVGVLGGEEVVPGVWEVRTEEGVVDVVDSGCEGGRRWEVGVGVTDQTHYSLALQGPIHLNSAPLFTNIMRYSLTIVIFIF